MYFIGGTNNGRRDGGLPQAGAPYYSVGIISGSGARLMQCETYYRHEGFWLHESFETCAARDEAIQQFEQANPRVRRRV
jgi:hypothetical protein